LALSLGAVVSSLAACDGPPQTKVDMGDAAPLIPVGYDAFRRMDLWPLVRVGMRAQMRSTYDRSGGNEGADASHFLREESSGLFTTLDVEGPGLLAFVRTNHWHGSPWHYQVDGTDNVVTESSTATPDIPVADGTFLPAAAFPTPLALTWSTTQGADLSWIPIGFLDSFRLGYERTHYGTGYYIFQSFDPGAPLSAPLAPWGLADVPPADVAALIARAGEDIAPNGLDATTYTGQLALSGSSGAAAGVLTLAGGPAAVRLVRFDVAQSDALAFGRARLRVTWDDRAEPSVDVPVALFFGAGTLYNRDGREYLVRALPASIRFARGGVTLAAYFPMPFQRSARIELVSVGEPISSVDWQVRTAPWPVAAAETAYFHATYHDHPQPTPGQDLVFLDTASDEGGGAWCGSFVGTSFIFSDRADLGTLEGDPRFFFDDSQTPQAQGTGTEEWGGGGDYWNSGQLTTLPFAGHPTGAPSVADAMNSDDEIESAYRFLLADLFPFGRRARIQLEHGGLDDSTDHYQSVAYWYGAPDACLIATDSLQIGDTADEAAHAYTSPDASAPASLTSRYDWGVDTLNGQEVYAASTGTGRYVAAGAAPTELTLSIARNGQPADMGVLLRRTLDYGLPDQRAEVWVADADADTSAPGAFALAGIWYTAGSNRCLYSNPDGELGAPTPLVETSNRRFRDDELLIPRALTAGRRRLRLRIIAAPRAQPLYPGAPAVDPPAPAPAGSVWSEMRYVAYAWKPPEVASPPTALP
jgi:hypothetical protein